MKVNVKVKVVVHLRRLIAYCVDQDQETFFQSICKKVKVKVVVHLRRLVPCFVDQDYET